MSEVLIGLAIVDGGLIAAWLILCKIMGWPIPGAWIVETVRKCFHSF
jgi:hypothetical protein